MLKFKQKKWILKTNHRYDLKEFLYANKILKIFKVNKTSSTTSRATYSTSLETIIHSHWRAVKTSTNVVQIFQIQFACQSF